MHLENTLPIFSMMPAGRPYWEIYQVKQPLTQYFLMRIHALSPRQVKQSGCDKFELAFNVKGARQELLICVAKAGFKGLTVPWLERLYEELQIPERPRPSREAELVKALMKAVVPDASEEQLTEWAQERSKNEEAIPSGLTEEVMEVMEQQAAIDEDDKQEYEKQVVLEKKRTKKKAAEDVAPESAPGLVEDPAAAASSSRPLLPNPVPWEADNPTVFQAREWLLEVSGCKIHKDERYFHRWSITYPGGPQRIYTKVWTSSLSPLEALRQLLDKVWQIHFNCIGEMCPYNLRTIGSWWPCTKGKLKDTDVGIARLTRRVLNLALVLSKKLSRNIHPLTLCKHQGGNFDWHCRSWTRCGFICLAITLPFFKPQTESWNLWCCQKLPKSCSSLWPFHSLGPTSESSPVCAAISGGKQTTKGNGHVASVVRRESSLGVGDLNTHCLPWIVFRILLPRYARHDANTSLC